jgi:hypothetical protein
MESSSKFGQYQL